MCDICHRTTPCRCAEVEVWDACDSEVFTTADFDAAVEEALDDRDDTTGTLEVCGYVRDEIPEGALDYEYPLEWALETLAESYGNIEMQEEPERTDRMVEAAKAFVEAVREDFQVWTCHQVETVQVDIHSWIAEHRPHWLTKGDADA